MNKETILARMDATIAMLEKLNEESPAHDNFRMELFVSEGCLTEEGNYCGTVCCVAGWYPKYIPESGLAWYHRDIVGGVLMSICGKDGSMDVPYLLRKYHGFYHPLCELLFHMPTADAKGREWRTTLTLRILKHNPQLEPIMGYVNDPMIVKEWWVTVRNLIEANEKFILKEINLSK